MQCCPEKGDRKNRLRLNGGRFQTGSRYLFGETKETAKPRAAPPERGVCKSHLPATRKTRVTIRHETGPARQAATRMRPEGKARSRDPGREKIRTDKAPRRSTPGFGTRARCALPE